MNGWDVEVFKKVAAHPMFNNMADASADLAYHREELMDPASYIPDSWIAESCAVGSVDACVAKMREFKDAGADEIGIYGSTPAQNAKVVDAWERG
jgi:alkanesulfonate monooxygenase SsuD/methylene tetrahydromethanopterin reductase-like flavin-dependent oxidoreductase (luciferase family)